MKHIPGDNKAIFIHCFWSNWMSIHRFQTSIKWLSLIVKQQRDCLFDLLVLFFRWVTVANLRVDNCLDWDFLFHVWFGIQTKILRHDGFWLSIEYRRRECYFGILYNGLFIRILVLWWPLRVSDVAYFVYGQWWDVGVRLLRLYFHIWRCNLGLRLAWVAHFIYYI